jgi:hypothetical protein
MPNLDATAVFGVIPDKLAIASAIRNPGFESNLDTPVRGYDENEPGIQNIAGISWKTKV